MKKRKKAITKLNSYILNSWMKEYLKNNPTPKYSEQRKPKTNLERAESFLEIVGSAKMKKVIKVMEKYNDYTLDIGELKRMSDKMKAKKEFKKEKRTCS